MLGSVDATKKPLRIPPRFIPYMEKHGIYELFYEIAEQLIIKKPDDHLLYIKQCLKHASRSRDSPRIIIFSPPNFDKHLLAEYLEKKLNIKCIREDTSETPDSTDKIFENIKIKLKALYTQESGWLFIDFPRTALEARIFQRAGILPTHVVEIICTDEPSESNYSSLDNSTSSKTNSSIFINNTHEESSYEMEIHGLRDAYANKLITVKTTGKTLEEIGNEIIILSKIRKKISPFINYRILLIAPRGSGHRYIAKYLSNKYKLEYIDFDYLLEQNNIQNSTLGDKLRSLKCHWSNRPEPAVRIKVIENKLLSHECLKKGWILVGYPINVKDFQMLDLLPTVPNRVIILSIDEAICRKRVLSKLLGNDDQKYLNFDIEKVHLNEHYLKAKRDLKEYFENIKMLMDYVGKSAAIVDAGIDDLIKVKDMVDSCLARAPPFSQQRIRKSKCKIKPEDVEYEPDDPLDLTEIVKQIQISESLISLI
ncbi:hypothetical protein HCN44_005528 [Aphidius gifuensis]|uniref:Adenylate kinase n=1 Tax=Aphidius gifuensis TaxID=684658 RepID=A0A834Y3B3_APHGI|nr:adenylate kinase 8 [Aphidius gifuensis]KAF7997251.1 hypothetical protein HCN44_005528 [Aphidius gifuensis]